MTRVIVLRAGAPGGPRARLPLRERLGLAAAAVLALALLVAFLVVSFVVAIPLVAVLLVFAGRLAWRLRGEARRARGLGA